MMATGLEVSLLSLLLTLVLGTSSEWNLTDHETNTIFFVGLFGCHCWLIDVGQLGRPIRSQTNFHIDGCHNGGVWFGDGFGLQLHNAVILSLLGWLWSW
jgi:hypothetical protein